MVARSDRTRSTRALLLLMQATNGGAAASSGSATDAVSSRGGDAAAGEAAAELPLHVTEKILCRISPLESARHATVCKSWAGTVSARLARPVPHLFVCTPPDVKSDRRGHVVSVLLDGGPSPTTTIPSRVRSSGMNGMGCIGATPGGRVGFAAGWWGGEVVLVNPVTGALHGFVAQMPHLDNSRVLATLDALLVVDGSELVLWRKAQQDGGEEAWRCFAVTATLRRTNPIVSAVNCGGCFYLLHQDGCLSKVDAASPPPLRMEKLPVATLFSQTGAAFFVEDEGRLLECDGEVLFVRQRAAYKEEAAVDPCGASISRYVAGFEVYMLDVEEQRWTTVSKLPADRTLFVSPRSSFAVRASDTAGCRSNRIYFVDGKRYFSGNPVRCVDGGSSWGVYAMDARRVLFEHRVAEPGTGAEVFWFLPRV